jgi:aspartate/methionine/tyrosine aminotransferase
MATFRLLIENAGGRVTTYPFFLEPHDENEHGRTTRDSLRAILINSPHNPTDKLSPRRNCKA